MKSSDSNPRQTDIAGIRPFTPSLESGPQPIGGKLHRRRLWTPASGNHLTRHVARRWWHWPVIGALVLCLVGGFILGLSHSVAGDNVALMLRKLI